MTTTRLIGTMRRATVSSRLAAAVVLVLGLRTGHQAAAKDFSQPAYTSLKTRTQGQGDLCLVGGGSTSVSTGENGTTTTTCSGGQSDGMTCVNTSRMTSCHMPQQRLVDAAQLRTITVAGVAHDPESATPESDDTSGINQAPAIDDAPAVAPEPTTAPAAQGQGPSGDVVGGDGGPLLAPATDEQP